MRSSRRKFLGAGMALAASGLYVPAQNLTLRDGAFLAGGIPNPYTTNLRLWLKADGLALNNNDPVATFTDFSGLGRHFTAAGTARPTFQTLRKAGKPGVTFDGTLNTMSGTLDTGVTAYSLFMVFKLLTITSTPVPFKHGDGNDSYLAIISAGNRSIQHRSGGAPTTMADGVASTTNFELWSAISTAAPATAFRLNGAAQTLTPSSGVFTSPLAGAFLGSYGVGILFTNMTFCELLLYNVALTNAQRDATETYLMAKWTLP